MELKNCCFAFNSYHQAFEILTTLKKKKIFFVFYIKYYLISGLGIDWIVELKNMLQDDFKSKDFKMYVEVKKNYGLFISLVEKKINFIKLNANEETLKKLKEIGKLNKVLINPSFSIVDLSKTKNINKKLTKIIE